MDHPSNSPTQQPFSDPPEGPSAPSLQPARRLSEPAERQLVSPQRAVVLAYAIVLPVLALTFLFTWRMVHSQTQPPADDDFRLSGTENTSAGLVVDLGQPLAVSFTIASRQSTQQIYWVEALSQDRRIGIAGPFLLPPGQVLSETIELYPLQAGEGLPVKLLLHRSAGADPYRALDLNITVNPLE